MKNRKEFSFPSHYIIDDGRGNQDFPRLQIDNFICFSENDYATFRASRVILFFGRNNNEEKKSLRLCCCGFRIGEPHLRLVSKKKKNEISKMLEIINQNKVLLAQRFSYRCEFHFFYSEIEFEQKQTGMKIILIKLFSAFGLIFQGHVHFTCIDYTFLQPGEPGKIAN